MLYKKKTLKAMVEMEQNIHEPQSHYLSVFTRDKNGNRNYIVKDRRVGIAGISQACDYQLNEHLYLRFTKIQSIWINQKGHIAGITNIMLLTDEYRFIQEEDK